MWEGGRSGVDWQAQAVQAEDVRSLRPHQAAVLRAGVGGEEAVVLGLRAFYTSAACVSSTSVRKRKAEGAQEGLEPLAKVQAGGGGV